MSKFFVVVVSLALIVTIEVSPVWAAGGKIRSDKAAGPAGETGGGDGQASRGDAVGESAGLLSVQVDDEASYVILIREDEKLARDVYLILYEKWNEPIFDNISKSEQRHMDAVKRLIDRYGLLDPVEDDTVGVFTNFGALYNTLVKDGNESYCEALNVGIFIEELDIADIKTALEHVTSKDVERVFQNLLSGSYNHLSAFMSQYQSAECQ